MTELQQPIFDGKGKFSPWSDDDVAALTADQRRLYLDVAHAAIELQDVDSAIVQANDRVHAALDAVAEAEKNLGANKQSFHDLWRASFGR